MRLNGRSKVKATILARIRNNVYRSGEKIESIREISRKTDVSALTVSRAIEELVAEGYLCTQPRKGCFVAGPKVMLGTPVQAATITVGVLMQSAEKEEMTANQALTPVHAGLLKHDLNVLTMSGLFSIYKDDPFLSPDFLAAQRLRGLVTIGFFHLPYLAKLRNLGIPLVAMDVDASGVWVDSVFFENIASSAALVRALHGRGARRIAFVGGPLSPMAHEKTHRVTYDPCAHERLQGWRAGVTALGLAADETLAADVSAREPKHTLAAVHTLLQRTRPDAILSENPLATLQALDEAGLSAEIPVAGWTSDPLPAPVHGRLAAVAHCSYVEMGQAAARMLLARIASSQGPVGRNALAPRIEIFA